MHSVHCLVACHTLHLPYTVVGCGLVGYMLTKGHVYSEYDVHVSCPHCTAGSGTVNAPMNAPCAGYRKFAFLSSDDESLQLEMGHDPVHVCSITTLKICPFVNACF